METLVETQKLLQSFYDESPDYHKQMAPVALAQELIGKVREASGFETAKRILVISDLALLWAVKQQEKELGANWDITYLCGEDGAEEPLKAEVARESYNAKPLVVKYNNLKGLEKLMKFDVIVGNPPYQGEVKRKAQHERRAIDKGTGSGSRIWQKFVELAFSLSAKNAVIALIHPINWRRPSSKLASLYERLSDGGLKYLIANVDANFDLSPSISIDAYIYTCNQLSVSFQVYDAVSGNNFIWSDPAALPTKLDDKTLKLVAEVRMLPGKRYKLISGGFASNDTDMISKEKLPDYPYEVVNTSAQYLRGKRLWSRQPHQLQYKKKVLVCDSGSFGFMYDDGKAGMCHHTHAILVDSKEEGLALVSYLSSPKIIEFLSSFTKHGSLFVPANRVQEVPFDWQG